MNKDKITRKELYELVWTKTSSEILIKLNITNHSYRKICKELCIPTPPLGYWQKIKYGKPVKKLELPSDYSGKDEITLSDFGVTRYNQKNELHNLIEEIKNTKGLPLKVPWRLTNPVELIQVAYKEMNDRVKRYNYKDSTVNTGPDNINIDVSPKNMNRALRFMDTLIKLLRARNHDVVINGWITQAVIFNQRINFKLNEKHKRIKQENGWHTQIPTGILTFRYGESYRIKVVSEESTKIEHQLPKILALLELKGKEEKIKSEERKKYWEQRRIEEEKEKAIKERKEKELNDFINLFHNAERRHQANFIREYLSTIENQARLNDTLDTELQNWLEWANKKADWYDPLINVKDEILHDVDPDHINLT